MPSLAQFFKNPGALTVPGRLVRFRVVRAVPTASPGDKPTTEQLAVDAEALLYFVSGQDRREAMRDADEAVNALYKGAAVPPEVREEERAYHVLFRALRDVDPPHAAFARTVEELRGALVDRAFGDVWAEYNRMCAEEFPDYVDPVEFGRLVEDAKKKPLPALLESFDSDFVRRCMPGLAALLLPSGTRK